MRALVIVAATLVLFGASSASADPAPSEALKPLAGQWRCAGHFASNGKPIASTIRFEWDADAAALIKHHDDTPPNQYHAIELWTFAKAGGFRAVIADAYSGARVFTSAGWVDKTLTFERAEDGKPAERFTYTLTGDRALQVDWSVSRDGITFKLGDTLNCSAA
jgi:hypothetical protein